ncbi:Predicted phosphoesterase [Mesonia phycicola]|uniref:Predicted phosphoesterase n=1 Tax=Mesonia phycicola TaxID=579105 RepID=A0A1M6ETP2_9FLAO|nr:metallophosphatase domain-containing protein [Mesonia phycicola]SHI88768.1 Predicted phosphoesterase [Mesonia phycicola]
MNIICISDTHNFHDKLTLPIEGDLIIHAGDLTEAGTERELKDFFDWFSKLPYPYKICIAGNHDFYLENISKQELEELIPNNVIYLEDEAVNINGINFWGSPYTFTHHNWAFKKKQLEMETHWKKIPQQTNVLITHTPPKGVLDESNKEAEIGCPFLKEQITLKKPKFHIFGHLHENYGIVKLQQTTYINATSFIHNLSIPNPPIQIKFHKNY